ncbi:MAG: hypothetical protein HQL46_13650 [Gammaproteobacteria bacterium]|nr:hypothetical protein [Gammaproteobacteria bacterium]
MKGGNFILIIGSIVFGSILALALVPDDFWEHDLPIAEFSNKPQINANSKGNHLGRNNTKPAIDQVFRGNIDSNRPVNSGMNFNQLVQPINFPQQQFNSPSQFATQEQFSSPSNVQSLSQVQGLSAVKPLSPNNTFSFARKDPVANNFFAANGLKNNSPADAVNSMNNLMNNVALNNNNSGNTFAQNSFTQNTAAIQNNNIRPNNLNSTQANNQQLDIRTGPPITSDAVPPATHNDGRNQRPCSLCHQVSRANMANIERMTNGKTLSSKTTEYSGVIQAITNKKALNGWHRVHIWLRNTSGRVTEVILAPSWFLDFTGCSVQKMDQVSGLAFSAINNNNARITQTNIIYAKNIKINGNLCRLRSSSGLPLWSN